MVVTAPRWKRIVRSRQIPIVLAEDHGLTAITEVFLQEEALNGKQPFAPLEMQMKMQ